MDSVATTRSHLDSHKESLVDQALIMGMEGWMNMTNTMLDETDNIVLKQMILVCGYDTLLRACDKCEQIRELENGECA